MMLVKSLVCVLCTTFALAFATDAGAAGPAKAASGQAAANQREVEYAALENHVGAHVVVHTTNGTVRSGTLIKYTNVSLTVRLGPEAGSIDLSVPRNTARKLFVTIGAADPLFPNDTFQQEAKAGAKKN